MFSDTEALRAIANNYRLAAGRQTDLNERRRILSYAAIYDDLATRHEERTLDQLKEAQKTSSGPTSISKPGSGSAGGPAGPPEFAVTPRD